MLEIRIVAISRSGEDFDEFTSVLHQGKVVSLVTLVFLGLRLALLERNVSSNFLNPERS